MDLHVINQPDDELLKKHARWAVEADLALAKSEFQWLVKDNLEVGMDDWLNNLADFDKQEKELIDSIGFNEEVKVGTWMLLATLGGEPVGMARILVWDDQTIWSLNSIYVEPSQRNKGIGFTMLDKLKRTAKEFGGKQIQLSVYTRNVHAQKLYKKLGFIPYMSEMAVSL